MSDDALETVNRNLNIQNCQLVNENAALRAKVEALETRCDPQWRTVPIITQQDQFATITWPDGAYGAIVARPLIDRMIEQQNQLAAIQATVGDTEFSLRQQLAAMTELKELQIQRNAELSEQVSEMHRQLAAIQATVGDTEFSLRQQLAAMTQERDEAERREKQWEHDYATDLKAAHAGIGRGVEPGGGVESQFVVVG